MPLHIILFSLLLFPTLETTEEPLETHEMFHLKIIIVNNNYAHQCEINLEVKLKPQI